MLTDTCPEPLPASQPTPAITLNSVTDITMADINNSPSEPADTWGQVPVASVARNTYSSIVMVMERQTKLFSAQKTVGGQATTGPALANLEPISLSIGDPTVFGNFKTHPEVTRAVARQLEGGRANGYIPTVGSETARAAVARQFTHPAAPLTPADVVMTNNGCLGAIEMAISCLVDAGQNILLPRPSFTLYETIALARRIEVREYPLLPERQWEVDLEAFEALMDDQTGAVLINNPSNPCGSVFSRAHLRAILDVCARKRVPVISDEIYGTMVFGSTDPPGAAVYDANDGHDDAVQPRFYPMATLTDTVPILTVSGLAKQWLVPGWRCGWILIHDKGGRFANVRKGLFSLSSSLLGPSSLIQAAIPDIFNNVPASFFAETTAQIAQHAKVVHGLLKDVPGLQVGEAQGAMYVMVGIQQEHFPQFQDDIDFALRLNMEQRVEVLPGSCFKIPNFVRLVLTPPQNKLEEACHRIAHFCAKHYQ
ncbi:hypothetical protein IWQ60_010231 [Tieghemiomyces parasiticus]|uniref:Aminotransferase class I/classII large domain-containing protein n=1 Tax=Tieghemiomyces parasiticus TaxID=78921 RepID=A0A9W7ZR60_9FUNG|nr:hypothetical protein IWQ60_010231 [Tieghemiomyces parasiticus]